MTLDPSDFLDVIDLTPADFAAEGVTKGDSLLAEALSVESQLATAERYGSVRPGPVHNSSHAQALQDRAGAQQALTDAEGFSLPEGTPPHADYLTAMPERPGSAEDRALTRLRIEALNQPAELGGLGGYATADAAGPHGELGGGAGLELSDVELDAYALAGVDPVAEAAERILDRRARDAAGTLDVARREAAYQAELASKQQAQRALYEKQAQAAIDAARARGADETWINYRLSLRALPGHPDSRMR